MVIVSTDKTNFRHLMYIEDYTKALLKHINSNTTRIDLKDVMKIYKNAMELAKILQPILADKEYNYFTNFLKQQDIPTPKLLVKDHKKRDTDGNFPTRLVVPATNFTAAFRNWGYLGIKSIFDMNDINYS